MKKFTVCIFICLALYIFFHNSSISNLTIFNETKVIGRSFSFIYGAPHFATYDSYLYENGKITRGQGEFFGSISGIVNYADIEIILSNYSSIQEMNKELGQLSFTKNTEQLDYVVFDGFFLSENTNKFNTVYIIDKSKIIKKKEITLEKNAFIEDISLVGDTIYVVYRKDEMEEGQVFTQTFLMRIADKGIESTEVLKTLNIVNIDSYVLQDEYLLMSYLDEKNRENVVLYNIENRKIDNLIEIDDYYNFSEYNLLNGFTTKNDNIYFFGYEYNDIVLFTLNLSTNVIEKKIHKLSDKYIGYMLTNVEHIDETFYINLNDYYSGNGVIYELDENKINLEKILEFKLKDNRDDLYNVGVIVN